MASMNISGKRDPFALSCRTRYRNHNNNSPAITQARTVVVSKTDHYGKLRTRARVKPEPSISPQPLPAQFKEKK